MKDEKQRKTVVQYVSLQTADTHFIDAPEFSTFRSFLLCMFEQSTC